MFMSLLSAHLTDYERQLRNMNDRLFPILIIGERGTGKSELIKNLGNIVRVNHSEELKKQLLENKPFIGIHIDLIEYISFEEQKLIYQYITKKDHEYLMYLQTNDGEDIKCPQLYFTSQKSLMELYRDSSNYKPFIDTISMQLLVLPPLRELNHIELLECWRNVNANLKLQDRTYLATLENLNTIIASYLKDVEKLQFFGNFRDLEKLAIMIWRLAKENHFQVKETDVHKIIGELKKNIESEVQTYDSFFKPNKLAEDMIKEFRKALIEWAEKNYTHRSVLIEKLGISEKTYYNWKNEV
ncbi:MAG: hypothetical protein KatS3mg035_0092 [Bacteroidia bacterium]|nr:MAG: hypothetical protein KatS3mg035_0092 [Bacteroidia bacterium]